MENKDEVIQKIISMTSTKHVKIYKLSQISMPMASIAAILGTNAGHVWNVLKDYRERPEKAEMADRIR